MDDLISRQAAIDTAIEAADDWDGGTNIGRQKRIEKAIKALPPVQSEPKSYRMGFQAGYVAAQRWIPCSERLPKVRQDVLMQFEKNVAVGFLSHGDWNVNTGNSYYTALLESEDQPIAWMPLPAQYQEGENDEKTNKNNSLDGN